MFVHGWFHRDHVPHRRRIDRFRARHLTAGEGEFLGISEAAAVERMAAGRALIEEIVDRPAAGFVAPAWLYGPGALAAAKRLRFPVCEDHLRVWAPASGRILCRGPVISWASRSRARILSSLAAAPLLRRALHGAPVVRVAVHPGDTGVPALLSSIDRTLAELAERRLPARYRDLLDDGSARDLAFAPAGGLA
jgi:predicted deacetylase